MPVLRSRKISKPETKSPNPNKTLEPDTSIIEPLTPAKTSSHRRSPRLTPPTAAVVSGRKRKSPADDDVAEKGAACIESLQLASASIKEDTTPKQKRRSPVAKNLLNRDAKTVGRKEDWKDKGILSLRSGKKIVKTVIEGDKDAVHFGVNENADKASEGGNIKIEEKGVLDSIASLEIFDLPGNIEFQELDKTLTEGESGAVGTNKRKFTQAQKVKVEVLKVEDVGVLDQGQKGKDAGIGVKTRRHMKELKGKEKVVGDELLLDNVFTDPLSDNFGQKEMRKEPLSSDTDVTNVRRGLSREDKGKDKVVEDGSLSNAAANLSDMNSNLRVGNPHSKALSSTNSLAGNTSVLGIEDESDIVVNNSDPVLEYARIDVNKAKGRGYKERFRDIARKNAYRFAHFAAEDPDENQATDQPSPERTTMENEREVEDWPGPFSTAMRIIRDRKSNAAMAQQNSASNKTKTGTIKWVPKNDKSPNCSLQSTPKLQDLCLDILAKNAEAISSLEGVPDVNRHKLSHMLCNTRKMNARFLGLLVSGSPTEIRIRDCSWLTEEEFTKAFQKCEGSLLTVLQLDQCGRCLPDYLLSGTLARSPNALPVLTAISVKGACRLSDAGLTALITSAPALRSINLSQCSLLTSDGIKTLADSLGSILRELYLDDCQNIDPMLILPALCKLEQLEVLSLAGIQTVSDAFISKLVAVRGRNFKELVLTDCTKLTDSSLKAIAETCTSLHALDLSNLCRLTDSTLGYLTNGCRMIGKLKVSRTAFSDEAIAAYLEASGESLKELSLNNIRKVGDDTAISLARRVQKLMILDLSWCRNLTNEAIGLIVDSCLCLKVLKLFGCTQITNVFVDGHSSHQLEIIGLKMTPILKHLKIPEPQQGPLHYSTGSY